MEVKIIKIIGTILTVNKNNNFLSFKLNLGLYFEINILYLSCFFQLSYDSLNNYMKVVHNSQFLLIKKHKSSTKGEKNE